MKFHEILPFSPACLDMLRLLLVIHSGTLENLIFLVFGSDKWFVNASHLNISDISSPLARLWILRVKQFCWKGVQDTGRF